MDNLGLKVVVDNQKRFFKELQGDGYSEKTVSDYKKILAWFIEYLKIKTNLSKRCVFKQDVLDKFVNWKISERTKRSYHKSHNKRLFLDIALFFDWYFCNDSPTVYNRQYLEEQLDLYLYHQTFNHQRKYIEIKNELEFFFNYLETNRIRSLKRITMSLVDSFIEYKETHFYRKRSEYSKDYRLYIQSPIKKYFSYLFKKGLSTFDITPKSLIESPHLEFGDLISNYLSFRKDEEGISSSTLWHTKHVLKKFDYFLQTIRIREIDQVKITSLDQFIKRTYPSSNLKAIQHANSVLRRFFKYLYFTDQIKNDPSRHIIAAPIYKLSEVPKHLTRKELKQLLSGIDVSTEAGIRKWAIFSLLLFNGLRVGEVAKLTLDDILWDKSEIVVRDRKNGSTLLTILSDHTANAIKEYILKARPQKEGRREIFFTIAPPIRPMGAIAVSALVCRELKRYGLSGGGHRVRHTFAYNLLESGSSLEEVQVLLGHDDINSSRIYTKSSLSRMREHIVTNEV